MRVEKKILKQTFMEIILDSVMSMEEVQVTTEKLLKVIETLILAAECHNNQTLESKLNLYQFEFMLEKFNKVLINHHESFKPGSNLEYRGNYSLNEPMKAVRILMDKYKWNREEAVISFLQFPKKYAQEIFEELGNNAFMIYEKHKI